MDIEGWKVKRSACDGNDAMAVMKSLLNSPETWVPGTATLPGQTSLIRCFVRHGRRRWFQTIWVKGSRLMFFLTVGSLCSFYNPQLKNNQLASIVESTEKESVLGSTEIYTLGLTFAFLLLLRLEDFWKAFNVNEFGPSNVLLRVAVATISSPYWMVSRAGHRGVGFLASLFAFLRWARHFVSWIHYRLFFVRYWIRQWLSFVPWINCKEKWRLRKWYWGVLCSKYFVDRFVHSTSVEPLTLSGGSNTYK